MPSQWEMLLQSNAFSHWLGTNLESALNVLAPDLQLSRSDVNRVIRYQYSSIVMVTRWICAFVVSNNGSYCIYASKYRWFSSKLYLSNDESVSNEGACFTNDISSVIQIWMEILFCCHPNYKKSDPWKFLYMTRQLCCHVMCKNLLRSHIKEWRKYPDRLSDIKFELWLKIL